LLEAEESEDFAALDSVFLGALLDELESPVFSVAPDDELSDDDLSAEAVLSDLPVEEPPLLDPPPDPLPDAA
jgi:hypothetical protein